MRYTLHSLTGWMGTALTVILPQLFYGQWFFYFHYPLKQFFLFFHPLILSQRGQVSQTSLIKKKASTAVGKHHVFMHEGLIKKPELCLQCVKIAFPEVQKLHLEMLCFSYCLYFLLYIFTSVFVCFSPSSQITFPCLCGLSARALVGTVRSKLIPKIA